MVNLILEETGSYIDLVGDFTFNVQATDIGSISKAKSSYSWGFKIPKTESNINSFNLLGTIGNLSRFPYKKIKVTILDSGFTIASGANLHITGSDDRFYQAHITSGIVDFFKLIDNKTFKDINIRKLNHENTRQGIIDTWGANWNKPYRYGVASFNGKFNPDTPEGFTDFYNAYMIPSANCEWLFNRIFTAHGWTYTGMSDLKNVWMTYPRAAGEDDSGVKVASLEVDDSGYIDPHSAKVLEFSNTLGIDSTYIANLGDKLKVQANTEYAIRVPRVIVGGQNIISHVHFYVNGVQIQTGEYNTEFGAYSLGELNVGDLIQIKVTFSGTGIIPVPQYPFEVNKPVIVYAPNVVKINWTDALIELQLKDFIKEMMMQQSVVAIADSVKKHIKFMSVDDRLSSPIVDISKIFIKKESAKYLYKNYAQNNYLTHKYDEDGQNYADGNVMVNNKNLKIENTMYEGISYAPLKNKQIISINDPEPGDIDNAIDIEVPIFKMYDLEVKDQNGIPNVNYKPLDKRFYFHKLSLNTYTGISINGSTHSTGWYRSIPIIWHEIVNSEYGRIQRIIGESKIFKIKIALNRIEAHNFRLDRRYYIEQLGAVFLVNKMTYKAGKPAEVELVKID